MAKVKRRMVITVDPDGTSRVRAMNDDPGHSAQLQPFAEALSEGDHARVEAHIHDHAHGTGTVHTHGGSTHSH
jgi:hypothetical protein